MRTMNITDSLNLKLGTVGGSLLSLAMRSMKEPSFWFSLGEVAITAAVGASVAFLVTKFWNWAWAKINKSNGDTKNKIKAP